MLTPFLTDLDTRAAIKGSRDPLGVQTIWTRLGRHVVGNLTTVSTSVRDFTVTLLGYHFAELVAEKTGASDDLGVFTRWEQLAAYARGGVNNDWTFRGRERAQKRWSDGGPVKIGVDSASLILSDQKTYGLWGLYSRPARTSGLLESTPSRLTPGAREFVERNYASLLEGGARGRGTDLVELLKRSATEMRRGEQFDGRLEAIARVLSKHFTAAERDLYTRHLVDGGPTDSTNGAQRFLAGVMREHTKDDKWLLTPTSVIEIIERCSKRKGDTGDRVTHHLTRIRDAEGLLAASVRLFGFVLASDGQTLKSTAAAVSKEWRGRLKSVNPRALSAMEPELVDASGDPTSAKRWLAVADGLSSGDFQSAIRLLIEQNHAMMSVRGGHGAWVELSRDKLNVKLAFESGKLPSFEELNQLWIHPYFLDSLRFVARQLAA